MLTFFFCAFLKLMTGRRDYNVAFQTAQSQDDSRILIMTADVFTLTSPESRDLLRLELCVQKQHAGPAVGASL